MINRALLEWISNVKKTKNETEIKNELIRQNWNLNDINEALDVSYGRKNLTEAPQQSTRVYSSDKEFQNDLPRWQKLGWVVVSQTGYKEPYKAGKGCCLFVIFAPLAFFARGKSKIIVTFEYRGKILDNSSLSGNMVKKSAIKKPSEKKGEWCEKCGTYSSIGSSKCESCGASYNSYGRKYGLWIVIGAIFVIFLMIAGCQTLMDNFSSEDESILGDGSITEDGKEVKEIKMDETFKTDRWKLAVEGAKELNKVGNIEKDDKKFIVIQLKHNNEGLFSSTPNFDNLYLLDNDGNKLYNNEELRIKFYNENELELVESVGGYEQENYYIIFKADKGAKDFKFIIDTPDIRYKIPINLDFGIDFDEDGLVNKKEKELKTDLKNPDTDGDGYEDGEEVDTDNDPLINEKLGIEINKPKETETINESSVEIKGKVNPVESEVTVNGEKAGVDSEGNFGIIVPLEYGENKIEVVGEYKGEESKQEVNVNSTKKVYSEEEIQTAQKTLNDLVAINWIKKYEVDKDWGQMYIYISQTDWDITPYEKKQEFLRTMSWAGRVLFDTTDTILYEYYTNKKLGSATRYSVDVK